MTALLGLGGFLVMSGELTLGQLVAAELVVGTVGAGFVKLGKHLETAYDLLAGLDKLGAVLDLPTRPAAPSNITPAAIELRDLAVGSAPHQQLCLSLRPGQSVALDLPRETTAEWAATLSGRRAAANGTVLIEGKRASTQQLRDTSSCLDDVRVLPVSVMDNLRLGAPALDTQSAEAALQVVGLDQLVRSLPAGPETKVLPTTPFDPAARTRLALARLLVSPNAFVVIDSAFDYVGLNGDELEHFVRRFLGALPSPVLVISQRQEVRRACSLSAHPTPVEGS